MFISKKEVREKVFTINSLITQVEIDLHYTGRPHRDRYYGYTGFVASSPSNESVRGKLDYIIKELRALLNKSEKTRERVSEEFSKEDVYKNTLEEKLKELSIFENFEVFYLKEKADKKLNLTHTFYRCRACKARVEKSERLLHAEQVHYTNVFYTIKTHKGETIK